MADLLGILTPAELAVVQLRVAGLDFAAIGRARGTSRQNSHALYARAVAKLHGGAALLRAESAGV